MFSIKIIFILIKSIELIIFVLWGNRLARTKSSKDFWKQALVPIFTFGIIEGIRFGRGIDWNVYFYRYTDLTNNVTGNYEFIFEWLCHIEGFLGLPYPAFILINEFVFIISIMFIVSKFREYSTYILPFVLSYSLFNENFIRWSMAVSFFFLSIYFLIANKLLKSYIFFIIAFLTHSGSIILVPIILGYKIFKNYQLNSKISLLILFTTTFVMSLTNLSFLVMLSNYLGHSSLGDIQAGGYFDATEDLLAGTWGNQGIADKNVISKIRFFLGVAPIIYYAPQFIKKNTGANFIYNLFLLGAVLSPLFSLIEIFNRFSALLMLFGCIIGGITYSKLLKSNVKGSIKLLVYLSMIFQIYPILSTILFREGENNMLFLWNANGRDCLPYWGLNLM